jgi:ADP-ribose pyrophosphatase YjhB (NUDIX family)
MFVWKDDKLLMIERGLDPVGFAVPAGHVDDDTTYEAAAIRELKEEVGLDAQSLELIFEGRKENACRREDGSWHYWKLYRIEAKGELQGDPLETKRVGCYSREEIKRLALRTESYLKGEIAEAEWRVRPGLEPVMYEWFSALHII